MLIRFLIALSLYGISLNCFSDPEIDARRANLAIRKADQGYCEDSYKAYDMVKIGARRILRYPGTSAFSNEPWRITKNCNSLNCRYKIHSEVYAKTGYDKSVGAIFKARLRCELSTGKWRMTTFEYEDKREGYNY